MSVGLVIAVALVMVVVSLHQHGGRKIALDESEALRLAEGLETSGERNRIARGVTARARAESRPAMAAPMPQEADAIAPPNKHDKLKWEVNRLLSIARSLTGDSTRMPAMQVPDVQLSQIKELNDIANDDDHPNLMGWPASDKSEGVALQLAERPSAPLRHGVSSVHRKVKASSKEALALEMAENPSAPLDLSSRALLRDTQRKASMRAARMSQLHAEPRPVKVVKRAVNLHAKLHLASAMDARKVFKGVDDLTVGAQAAMSDVLVPASKIRRGWMGM
ncbi:hypothetical protein GUITHDRAFT_149793 [Guillardia theta CCMP2712]|uniref:Uncharacterized protein n=2 Tax=Guillardia theta TaxID=55529 RepID=L1K4A0_GUITC|nr:hypothetical protein GUITHDRAFT_149793 [Guillardia theta CCMP2712]EKX55429.1 hypothetical protein GUITHDRAFT_149793 [Guillardia theta CCMP2712]|eukprot:XP_005842409.1 hypothetical protein GUITHDRAFT_149793 [Guillardia theta CCMP2712]